VITCLITDLPYCVVFPDHFVDDSKIIPAPYRVLLRLRIQAAFRGINPDQPDFFLVALEADDDGIPVGNPQDLSRQGVGRSFGQETRRREES
jgi:hypothetical protein